VLNPSHATRYLSSKETAQGGRRRKDNRTLRISHYRISFGAGNGTLLALFPWVSCGWGYSAAIKVFRHTIKLNNLVLFDFIVYLCLRHKLIYDMERQLPELPRGGKYINILTDWAFKRIFSGDSNKRNLIELLNDLLDGEKHIRDLAYLPTEELGDNSEQRRIIFDLKCI